MAPPVNLSLAPEAIVTLVAQANRGGQETPPASQRGAAQSTQSTRYSCDDFGNKEDPDNPWNKILHVEISRPKLYLAWLKQFLKEHPTAKEIATPAAQRKISTFRIDGIRMGASLYTRNKPPAELIYENMIKVRDHLLFMERLGKDNRICEDGEAVGNEKLACDLAGQWNRPDFDKRFLLDVKGILTATGFEILSWGNARGSKKDKVNDPVSKAADKCGVNDEMFTTVIVPARK